MAGLGFESKYVKLEGTKLYYENGVYLGDILCKEDGFYDFWPDLEGGGFWSARVLRAIADLLDFMNLKWELEIAKDFSSNLKS